MKDTILEKIADIEKEKDVRILFAIESGSRAWGFPSPDSDYDVRFVYARPTNWYLSLNEKRDVIEYPIDGLLDINGWDIKKALNLLMKPNPVLLEWLSSPIKYSWNEEVCQKLITLANEIVHKPACLYHYLHLGQRQFKVYIQEKEQINLKKYLYAIRPAMAINWVKRHPDTIPPMNFFELRDGLELPLNLITDLDNLIELKSQQKEVGHGSPIQSIDEFVLDQFKWAEENAKGIKQDQRKELYQKAEDLFIEIVI